MEKQNILAYIGGGLGDQVTAEPALRYALDKFKDQLDISILAHNPSLFSHLKFKEIFTVNGPAPEFSKYIMRGTYPLAEDGQTPKENIMLSICSMNTNPVDFCALQLMGWELPFDNREILLTGVKPEQKHERYADPMKALDKSAIIIHPGISGKSGWNSKDFPVKWWDDVVDCILRMGAIPIIIGQDSDANGVAKLTTRSGAIDLTNKLNIKELIYVLQRCKVLITNDSLPLHIAASREPEGGGGDAWIGYIATAKHPDFLMHYRHGKLGYRMKNLSTGGVWKKPGIITDAKTCTEEEMNSWLPQPSIVARWAILAGRGEIDE